MNLQNILNEIQSADPEFGDRVSPRRAAIRTFLRGASLAALPVAFGGLLQKAYGKTNDAVTDVLNFALTLEYLESEFYKAAVSNAASIGINGDALRAITIIRDHENAHVAFLRTAITGAGATPVTFTASNFDFSGGSGTGTGPYAAALTNNYPLFLAVAQTFEDTGVRAYKGQAPNLMADGADGVLTAALQIHSVEARHAAHIRLMRKTQGGAFVAGNVKPWITGNQSNIADPGVQASYDGEEVTVQAGVAITGFASAAAASESFDEPLTKEAVLNIVKPFLKP